MEVEIETETEIEDLETFIHLIEDSETSERLIDLVIEDPETRERFIDLVEETRTAVFERRQTESIEIQGLHGTVCTLTNERVYYTDENGHLIDISNLDLEEMPEEAESYEVFADDKNEELDAFLKEFEIKEAV